MENFLDTAGTVATFFCVCLIFSLIFKKKEEYGPLYAIHNWDFSSKQQDKIISAITEVERVRKKNRWDETYEMKLYYFLNLQEFNFDLSEKELDALLFYLGWHYYDYAKGKIRKKKI